MKLNKGDQILLGDGWATVENDMVDRVYYRWNDDDSIGWVYRYNIIDYEKQ